MMRTAMRIVAVVLFALHASAATTWLATSRTAMSITGDIALAPERITLRRIAYPLTLVREIAPRQLQNAGKVGDYSGQPSSARLYKTLIPKSATLANANTICGPNRDARWILAVFSQAELSLAVFSGDTEPDLDYKAVAVSHDLCGTYAYRRK